MPLRRFQCKACGEEFQSFDKNPFHCNTGEVEELLVVPQTKFMEVVDEHKGKRQMVGQQKILKARARAHSRDVDTQDLVDLNPMDEAIKNGWVKEDGTLRKAIDDL